MSKITSMRAGRPATASMTSKTMVMMMAVPRSGWAMTSTMGMPARMSTRITSRQARPSSLRREQYVATMMIRARTANSEGWIWMKPSENQRCEPSAWLPMGLSTTSRAKTRAQ